MLKIKTKSSDLGDLKLKLDRQDEGYARFPVFPGIANLLTGMLSRCQSGDWRFQTETAAVDRSMRSAARRMRSQRTGTQFLSRALVSPKIMTSSSFTQSLHPINSTRHQTGLSTCKFYRPTCPMSMIIPIHIGTENTREDVASKVEEVFSRLLPKAHPCNDDLKSRAKTVWLLCVPSFTPPWFGKEHGRTPRLFCGRCRAGFRCSTCRGAGRCAGRSISGRRSG